MRERLRQTSTKQTAKVEREENERKEKGERELLNE